MATPKLSSGSREQLTALFGADAEYVRLLKDGKNPAGAYKKNRSRRSSARTSVVPLEGNYGVIPEGRLFVLDIDCHQGGLSESVSLFSKLFDVDLLDTLYVKTPSGGYHFYLLVPNNESMPNGSIRSYAKHIGEYLKLDKTPHIDADVRSGSANGYVVGPGSFLSIEANPAKGKEAIEGHYTLQGRSREILRSGSIGELVTISSKSASFFEDIRSLQNKAKADKRPATSSSKKPESEPQSTADRVRPDSATVTAVRNGLERRLKSEPDMAYHRRRAFVAASLRCCYSDYTVAVTCVELGIDHDTYRNEKIDFWAVEADIQKLRNSGVTAENHTAYCPEGRKARAGKSRPIEDVIADTRRKVKERTLAMSWHRRNPRAVDVPAVTNLIFTVSHGKFSQVGRDALTLIDTLFSPMLNVGASRVVVAPSAVAEGTGLTRSRVSAAIRFLKKLGVLQIVDRQRTGLAATYTVRKQYLDRELSLDLRRRWKAIKDETGVSSILVFDRRLQMFVELRTGEIYESKLDLPDPELDAERKCPDEVSIETFVRRYLRNELARG